MRQGGLFEKQRLQMTDSIRLTAESLQLYGALHEHWAVAWSGGKDSTATLTVVLYMLSAKMIPRPKTLTVLLADTRLELAPLWEVASDLAEEIRARGVEVRVVTAPMDKRFTVNIFGRGVPPPNNATNRWCTRQIKVDPMRAELERMRAEHGKKFLVLTGLRRGESAARDARITLACSKDDGECGQGWYQETLPEALCDTLSAVLRWRVCHVWEWLRHWAPKPEFGDWDTEALAMVYGGDEAEETNARFGCTGCALTQEDKALKRAIAMEGWGHLRPLLGLQPLYEELRQPRHRLRLPGGKVNKDGALAAGQNRLGPLTPEARLYGLGRVLAMQGEANEEAEKKRRTLVNILNAEEEARIRQLIAEGAYPEGWTGDESLGSALHDRHFDDGTVQPLLPMFTRTPGGEL
jgi:DNA sulfur modification protein DndC